MIRFIHFSAGRAFKSTALGLLVLACTVATAQAQPRESKDLDTQSYWCGGQRSANLTSPPNEVAAQQPLSGQDGGSFQAER